MSCIMTLVSNDPSWWPIIDAGRIASYFVVAASAGVMYDWALAFGEEVELIWRQRWSLVTFLYISVRYVGIIFAVINVVLNVPTISATDSGCWIMYFAMDWMTVVIPALLGAIMIVRLYAMYLRSRKVLIFLVVIFLTVNIVDGVIATISMKYMSSEELILSGTYQCALGVEGEVALLGSISWINATIWEVLALCFAVWIALKHFRELRQHSAGGIIEDCFTVLMKTHVGYFASFVAASCFELGYMSPTISADPDSLRSQIYNGVFQIFFLAQMFVLGPRLVLSVREYHAKLVADSDVGTAMISIAFQERMHVSTGSGDGSTRKN